jgi:hypothetical protein
MAGMVRVVIELTDISEAEGGGTHFIPGSHVRAAHPPAVFPPTPIGHAYGRAFATNRGRCGAGRSRRGEQKAAFPMHAGHPPSRFRPPGTVLGGQNIFTGVNPYELVWKLFPGMLSENANYSLR